MISIVDLLLWWGRSAEASAALSPLSQVVHLRKKASLSVVPVSVSGHDGSLLRWEMPRVEGSVCVDSGMSHIFVLGKNGEDSSRDFSSEGLPIRSGCSFLSVRMHWDV